VDWRGVLKGYKATTDWPWCTYYKELMRAFPEAKVLLSVRDPEEWYESTITTIYGMYKIKRYLASGPSPVPAGGDIGVWGDSSPAASRTASTRSRSTRGTTRRW
jgi:hypothetical protein